MIRLTQLFFVAVLCSFLFACEDDTPTPDDNTNDTTTITSHELVGAWDLASIEYEGTITSEAPGFPASVTSFTGTGTDMSLMLDFSEDPNDYTSSGNYSVEVAVESFGQIITETWVNESFIGDGTWAEADNILTVTNSGGEQTATIEELTDTQLIVAFGYSDVTVLAGVTTTQDVQGTYTFTKQ
ncbi:MAG: hypothetical protein ACPG5B_05500 [Chitinophagales bacterium]